MPFVLPSAFSPYPFRLFLQELFKRVLPYECLTRREIDRTCKYFNAVANRVIGTVLNEENDRNRARLIEKWIDVAQECRQLRNYSSLTAILNGLLSGPVYRLETSWSFVTLAHRSTFNELKNVFESCGDRKQMKDILDKVKETTPIRFDTSFLSRPFQQLEEIRRFFKERTTMIHSDLLLAINEILEKNAPTIRTRDSQENVRG